MPGHRRKFSTEEKLGVLRDAKELGITAALRKHNLSYSVYHRWKGALAEEGKEEAQKGRARWQPKMKELLEENALLKKIITNQALLLELSEVKRRARNRGSRK